MSTPCRDCAGDSYGRFCLALIRVARFGRREAPERVITGPDFYPHTAEYSRISVVLLCPLIKALVALRREPLR